MKKLVLYKKVEISLTQKVPSSPEGIYVSSQHSGSEDGCVGGSHVVSKVPIEDKTQKCEKRPEETEKERVW